MPMFGFFITGNNVSDLHANRASPTRNYRSIVPIGLDDLKSGKG